MSSLIKQALNELEKLSPEDQNAVAARWSGELKDEQLWTEKFSNTTDEQWDKLAGLVKQDIAKGDVTSLKDFPTTPALFNTTTESYKGV